VSGGTISQQQAVHTTWPDSLRGHGLRFVMNIHLNIHTVLAEHKVQTDNTVSAFFTTEKKL